MLRIRTWVSSWKNISNFFFLHRKQMIYHYLSTYWERKIKMKQRKATVDLQLYSTNSIEIRRTGGDHLFPGDMPDPARKTLPFKCWQMALQLEPVILVQSFERLYYPYPRINCDYGSLRHNQQRRFKRTCCSIARRSRTHSFVIVAIFSWNLFTISE